MPYRTPKRYPLAAILARCGIVAQVQYRSAVNMPPASSQTQNLASPIERDFDLYVALHKKDFALQ
ncbi:MAG: hypothetical protein MJA83_01500 [Gammaproteobacteria bacterium]|nr:hypothetical protein [Gammaproteobacteria bacterium]